MHQIFFAGNLYISIYIFYYYFAPFCIFPPIPLLYTPGEEVVVQENHPEPGAQDDGGGQGHQQVVPGGLEVFHRLSLEGWGCFTGCPQRVWCV